MSSILRRALTLLVGEDMSNTFSMPPKSRPLKALTERQLIQLESEIGSKLFGPIPDGHRREFFNLDPTTWVWHEEWVDAATGKKRAATTRYEVHDKGVLKVQEGARYNFLEGKELENLTLAVRLYHEQVMRGVYKRDAATGKKLA